MDDIENLVQIIYVLSHINYVLSILENRVKMTIPQSPPSIHKICKM